LVLVKDKVTHYGAYDNRRNANELTSTWSHSDIAIRRSAPVNRRPCAYTEHIDHGLYQLPDHVTRLVCWQLHRAAATFAYTCQEFPLQ